MVFEIPKSTNNSSILFTYVVKIFPETLFSCIFTMFFGIDSGKERVSWMKVWLPMSIYRHVIKVIVSYIRQKYLAKSECNGYKYKSALCLMVGHRDHEEIFNSFKNTKK
jgi:hypothetical protein